jgi:MFS transporter, DHA2 family, methylenomycin A resistance protein
LSMLIVATPGRRSHGAHGRSRSGVTLAAAVLGFFVITLDAVVVNVALPSIRSDLGGGITGLQRVVDGYTLMFAARFLQGAAAAVLLLSSMALIRQAYADATRRGRAVAVWAMGGAVASSSGPVLGGLLSLASWRLIFAINLPVGAVALGLLAWTEPSPHRSVPVDGAGR